MTHPLDLDELAVVDKMHSRYSATDAMGSLLLEGVGGGIDMLEWGPCEDQTLVGVDIDLMVMSCLRGKNKNFIENFSFLFFFGLAL